MMRSIQDHYSILQISSDATSQDIKTAYKGLAREYHPDVNPDDPLTIEKFHQISEAYEVLSDKKKRHDYFLEFYVQSPNQKIDRTYIKALYDQPPFTFNRRAEKLYKQGEKQFQNQKHTKAIDKYTQAIDLDSQFIAAYLKRCEAYNQLGNYRGILDDCHQIITINPLIAKAYYYQGRARYNLGFTQGAINSYTEVIRQYAHHAQSYYYRGLAYQDTQNPGLAIRDFKAAKNLFKIERNQEACILIQEHIHNLTNPKLLLKNLVDECFSVLQSKFKTANDLTKAVKSFKRLTAQKTG